MYIKMLLGILMMKYFLSSIALFIRYSLIALNSYLDRVTYYLNEGIGKAYET